MSEALAPAAKEDFFPWFVSSKCTFLVGWAGAAGTGKIISISPIRQQWPSAEPQPRTAPHSRPGAPRGNPWLYPMSQRISICPRKCWKKWSSFRHGSLKGFELPKGHHSQGLFKNSQVEIQISFPRGRIFPGFLQTNNVKSRDYPALGSVEKKLTSTNGQLYPRAVAELCFPVFLFFPPFLFELQAPGRVLLLISTNEQ